MRRLLLRLSLLVRPVTPSHLRTLGRTIAPLALVALFAQTAHATSFLPVTFDDLIAQSDVIFVGEVADVRPFTLQTREGTIVKTRVTFRVTDPLSGDSSIVQVLDFLGGEADGVGLRVSGMPTFTVGDRRIVFARHDQTINPIVGFTQGLMRVTRDVNGVDRVQTLEGAPLVQPESIGGPLAIQRAPMTPMRLDDFRVRIRQAWAARRQQ